jgi:hypothetical protein
MRKYAVECFVRALVVDPMVAKHQKATTAFSRETCRGGVDHRVYSNVLSEYISIG